MVRRENERVAAERKKRDLEKQAKERAEGKTSTYEGQDTNDSWGRGSLIQETKKNVAE